MQKSRIVYVFFALILSVGFFVVVQAYFPEQKIHTAEVVTAVPENIQQIEEIPPVTEIVPRELPVNTDPIPPIHPVRIIIPALGIDTKVHDVGVTTEGLMDVPKNLTDVGWYKYGTAPGAAGNAVLDGHLNDGGSIDGVFKNLSDLQAGDPIYVVGADGTQLEFVMTASKTLDRNASTKDIFATDGPPQLRIITCQGKWLTTQKTHERRLVVTAVLVDQG